jgi:hypothetical protein
MTIAAARVENGALKSLIAGGCRLISRAARQVSDETAVGSRLIVFGKHRCISQSYA